MDNHEYMIYVEPIEIDDHGHTEWFEGSVDHAIYKASRIVIAWARPAYVINPENARVVWSNEDRHKDEYYRIRGISRDRIIEDSKRIKE